RALRVPFPICPACLFVFRVIQPWYNLQLGDGHVSMSARCIESNDMGSVGGPSSLRTMVHTS
ncbi:MAG: hypothetical protein ACXWWI_03540, partial [Nitrospira sp.]